MKEPIARSLAAMLLISCTSHPAPVRKEAAKMTANDRTDDLLVLAREARWTFPSSTGRPVGAEAPPWAQRLVREREAIVETARRMLARGHRAAATELAASTWRTWVLARDEARGRTFLGIVLDAPGPHEATRHRALALYGDGLLAFRLGDLGASRARSEAALDDARRVGDREAIGLALLGLSRVEISEGRGDEARKHAAESRSNVRDLGPSYDQAPLHMLAQATRLVGTADEAAALFEESLAQNRKIADRGMVLVELHNLGHVQLRRGEVDKAERCFSEIAEISGPANDPYDQAMRLFNGAAVAFARKDVPRAQKLLGEARAVIARDKVELATDDARELDDLARRLEAAR